MSREQQSDRNSKNKKELENAETWKGYRIPERERAVVWDENQLSLYEGGDTVNTYSII